MVRKGIPKEVLKELDIRQAEEHSEEELNVTAIVEKHQIKLPIPGKIRKELDFKKGQKLNLRYDVKRKRLIYSF